MVSFTKNLAIPLGSLVVATGANGYIGSHICDQLLTAGFVVRGTVRDSDKAAWLSKFFEEKYGKGKFEAVVVPAMEEPNAFDGVTKGASGFIHSATWVAKIHDPNVAIPMSLNGALNALSAAAKEKSITRFVQTSSSTATTSPKPNNDVHISSSCWNEEALEKAWRPPPYEGPERLLDVYCAAKTQAEKSAWKWYEDNKPGFVLNMVNPYCNQGKILIPSHQGATNTTVGWTKALWDGFPAGTEDMKFMPPQYYVNVQDTARIHVGALIYSDVEKERLHAWAHPFTWNDFLAIFRTLYPERKFIDNIEGLGKDLSTVENERAEEVLKRIGGRGWVGMNETLKDAAESWT